MNAWRRVFGIGKTGLLVCAGLALASCAQIANQSAPGNGDPTAHKSPQALAQLGDAARRSGDLPGAVELYRKSLGDNPRQTSVWLALGSTLLQGGDTREAAEAYTKALKVAPKSVEAHLGLGRVYIAERKPHEALVEFTAALAIDPKAVRAYNDQGIAYDMIGNHKAAKASYAKGLLIAPDNVALRNNLGLSLAITGNYDKAIADLSKLAMEPGSTPRVRQNLALAFGLKGDDKDAERLLRYDLDEQSVVGDLQYFAAIRELSHDASSGTTPTAKSLAALKSDQTPAASRPAAKGE